MTVKTPEGSVWYDPKADIEFTIEEEPDHRDERVTIRYDNGDIGDRKRKHFHGFELVDSPEPKCRSCGTRHPKYHVQQGNKCTVCRRKFDPEEHE